MRSELLPDGHRWWRIASADWQDPLDPHFARHSGGRWNPPESYPTLYLNEDLSTARGNLRLFIDGWPYEPEDLRDDNGPVLVGAILPRRQRVLDAHTESGLAAAGLPMTYPFDAFRNLVPHESCQPIGVAAHAAGMRGVHCRSARSTGRELAWFPATARSRAREVARLEFGTWFWALASPVNGQ